MPFSEGRLVLDAVVFDLDGTLIDSTDVYIRILNTAFERIGLPEISRNVALVAIREGGFNWNKVLPEYLGEQRDKMVQKAMEVIREIYPRMFRQGVKLIPGAKDVLMDISKLGLKLGLVTSTQMKFLEDKLYPLKRAGIGNLFEAIITTDDVPERKPAADPLIECGKRLSVDLGRVLYAGDTCVDIRAGKAAGTITIGVLTGVDDYESLKSEQPDAILDSVAGLREILVS